MLAGLIGALVAGGLLLRGAGDVWAQSALLLIGLSGVSLWLGWGAARGCVPAPSRLPAAWAAVLALLSLASALASPAASYAVPAWAVGVAGLAAFPAATLSSARERENVEQALRATAWALVLLAIHQRFHGLPRPPSALSHPSVFAGAILLLLPVAVRRGDGALAACLLLCLWWTRSVGAWLGLAAAAAAHRRAVGPAAFWAAAGAGLFALAAALVKLPSLEAGQRFAWWGAAWRMAADAPWLGVGPGTFHYALPAYAGGPRALGTPSAHQHLLETAAERGWVYAAVWFGGLAVLLRRAAPSRRFGPLAALVHGFFSQSLSTPAVYWLFCLCASWALPESAAAPARVRKGSRLPLLAGLALAAGIGAAWLGAGWRADRLRVRAIADLSDRRDPAGAEAALIRSERARPHPEAARMRAELALARGAAAEAIVHLERAAAMDPYRASTWTRLEETYRRAGRLDEAARTRARGARTCPALRPRA